MRLLALIFSIIVFSIFSYAKPLEPVVVKKNVDVVKRQIRVAVLGFPMLSRVPPKNFSTDKMIAYLKSKMDVVVADKPDIIVTPEHADNYAWLPLDQKLQWMNQRGETIYNFMRDYAKKHRCYIVFATYRYRGDVGKNSWSNCAILIDRDGDCIGVYDKNYLTIGEMENGVIPGKEAVVVDTDFGRVGMVICFDLNFWDLMKRYADLKPDILTFSSFYHGAYMQNTWAHRCESYLLGATIGNTIDKNVVGPAGEVLAREHSGLNWISIDINTNFKVLHWDNNREKIMEAKKKYGRVLDVHTPNECGLLPVFSNDPNIPIEKILKEFEIESWSDYYQRSVKMRSDILKKIN